MRRVRSVTLNGSAIRWPTTHAMRPSAAHTNGTRPRRRRGTFSSTKKSCSFFASLMPKRLKPVAVLPCANEQPVPQRVASKHSLVRFTALPFSRRNRRRSRTPKSTVPSSPIVVSPGRSTATDRGQVPAPRLALSAATRIRGTRPVRPADRSPRWANPPAPRAAPPRFAQTETSARSRRRRPSQNRSTRRWMATGQFANAFTLTASFWQTAM